ncbi:thioesterase family protein [Gordonia sp. NPDC003376]
MDNAFYLPVPDLPDEPGTEHAGTGYEYFQPTPATVSPWSTDIQHGGPPTGLLMRALERTASDPGLHFTRVTVDLIGAVGLDVNRVRARVARPGRRISMVTAELEVRRPDGGYRVAARASAWLMRADDTAAITGQPLPPLHPLPDDLDIRRGVTADPSLGVDWGTEGFIGAVHCAVLPGRTGQTAAVWLRPAVGLVEGEQISDLESIMTVVDVANGVGTRLDPGQWSWMNTDTTVHLTAVPRGQWLGIDAEMATGRDGFGASFADLYDLDGFIGRSAQTALLDGR